MPVIELIEKETIEDVKFVKADPDQTTYYRQILKYFERLGNEFKGKCIIAFNTTEGHRKVNTTVWSVTEDYVQLKGGISIPLSSIIGVRL